MLLKEFKSCLAILPFSKQPKEYFIVHPDFTPASISNSVIRCDRRKGSSGSINIWRMDKR